MAAGDAWRKLGAAMRSAKTRVLDVFFIIFPKSDVDL